MAIDALVKTVIHRKDGTGELELTDRPARPGGYPGIAGQRVLSFSSAPHGVDALKGREIWGGSEGIMLGEVEIARRQGYTRIVFHDDEIFKRAITQYE